MKMDMWKYFGITHTDHTVMNPMSLAKTKELIDLLRLPDGGRVLDVACGKAEFLCLVAEHRTERLYFATRRICGYRRLWS